MTSNQGAALHAVRATEPLTAAEAVAWFASSSPPGRPAIGYALSAKAATWLRLGSDGTVDTLRSPDDVLTEAYEMVCFDEVRELRWLRTPDGRGAAVTVGEEPASLPPGEDVAAVPPPRRGETQARLLAGTLRAADTAGWSVLHGERYVTAHLPVAAPAGQLLLVETVEYLAEDTHGNRDVADTRTRRLRAATLAQVRAVTGAAERGEIPRPHGAETGGKATGA